jgi:hypothetical protein
MTALLVIGGWLVVGCLICAGWSLIRRCGWAGPR